MFSVIIPSFNRSCLTIKAIQSVLNQSFREFELIVVDDGSTEDYHEIKALLQKHDQTYIKTENLGVAHARNTGLRNSTMPIISFLDSDDFWLSEKLERHFNFFANNQEIKVVQNYERWFRFGKEVQVPFHLQPRAGDEFFRSLKMCCIGSSSVSIKREVFTEVGYFKENLRICEDYDYWLRTSSKFTVGLIEDILSVKVSGTHPQLTSSESAFDRFRIYSLVSFLCDYLHDLLEDENRLNATIEVILFKVQILLNGANKRNLANEVVLYLMIMDILNQKNDYYGQCFDLAKLLPKLEQTLNHRSKLKKSSAI